MTENQWRLRELMARRHLDVATVAELTCYSRHAVVSWLKPKTSRSHRQMPDRALHLLKLQIDPRLDRKLTLVA